MFCESVQQQEHRFAMTPWIKTYSGKSINPLDVRVSDIDIHDMAHGLSKFNRFCGNTRRPIDVAYHSVWVSKLAAIFAPPGQESISALQGLVHDGSEYILGDVTKWLKRTPMMKEYRKCEDEAQEAVYLAFGCPVEMFAWVKAADDFMVRVEAEDTWGPNWSRVEGYGPLNLTQRALVEDWDPPSNWKGSFDAFMATYEALSKEVAV